MPPHKLQIPAITWPKTPAEAVTVQRELAANVRLTDDFGTLQTIAGIDVSYDMKSNLTRAVIVTMRIGEWETINIHQTLIPTEFPYIPGFLSFREIPAILETMHQLKTIPDLLMVDGQGIAHPRRLGIASHLGVLLDLPAIGVAKSRLTGKYTEPAPSKGATSPLMDKTEQIGTVLRSKERCNPLFISPGHRISHETALKLTLQALGAYRLPEPTRLADKISKEPFPENHPARLAL